MITIPVYDIILLPGVSFYFKKDAYEKWNLGEMEEGEDVLFLLLREQKDFSEMTSEDFYPVGFAARVEGVDGEGVVQMKVQNRVSISDLEQVDGKMTATASILPELDDIPEKEAKERFERMRASYLQFIQGFQWGVWARNIVLHWRSMEELVCASSGYLNLTWEEKYAVMAEDSRSRRYELMEQAVYEFIEGTKATEAAKEAQQSDHEKVYREAALKKQIDFLQKELDAMHPENISDVRKFELKIEESGMNETARREAEKVLNRMKQEGKEGHEYGMLYDYLDFVTSLSWKREEVPEIDLGKVEQVLDEDHYGLKKVKERIVQQMAVVALNKKQSGSILLFVGAPGTGKTSFGQGIARALGRKYVRISLGGVRDEAEIRGHRRTYIGAMPGRIMEGMKRCGVSNPVMVLDEVDKLAKEYSGDPASALLEVLDPEQNGTFTDHYMNVPYDLSQVLFVCTANTTDTIPEPLLNRMEVIQFPGYTAVEKFYIAKKHLLPRVMEDTGIKAKNLKVSDGAIRRMIEEYTMESGVRGLKKQLETLCRNAAVKLVKGERKSITVSEKKLPDYLGRQNLHHDKKLEEAVPGTVTGLAWTSAGGEILFIETRLIKGDGKLIITGQLGDVMKESVQIAVSVAKSLFPEEAAQLEEHDLHIHVPAGAVPKDGPSAGITITTAIASLLTGKAVSPEFAMTGEISLRGTVLPIGGLPEKLMAAQRAGITRVLIPADNVEDLQEVAEEVKEQLEIFPVKNISDVLKQTGI
ncbi:MAG: endopeptidase La [Lachnospiraceae bacterium]|nr:endopeptidase La [Lachnospiraceae bacterium]